MKHQITLTENDYITYYLYEASTNPLKRQNRTKSYLTLVFLALALAGFAYRADNNFLFYYGIFCTVLVIAFGRSYMKWRHKKHYTKHARQLLKNAFDETTEIEILEDIISTEDKTGKSEINISQLKEVSETANYYFIKLTSGPSLPVPKTDQALNEEILAMVEKHNLPHIKMLNWKW